LASPAVLTMVELLRQLSLDSHDPQVGCGLAWCISARIKRISLFIIIIIRFVMKCTSTTPVRVNVETRQNVNDFNGALFDDRDILEEDCIRLLKSH